MHRRVLSLCKLHQPRPQAGILALQGLDGVGIGGKDAMAEFVRQQMEGIVDRGLVEVAEDILQGRIFCRLADGQRDEEQEQELE